MRLTKVFFLIIFFGFFQHSFGQTTASTYAKLDSVLNVDPERFDGKDINALEGISLDGYLPKSIDTLALKQLVATDEKKATRYFFMMCLKMYQFHSCFYRQGFYMYTMRWPRDQFIVSHLKEVMGSHLELGDGGLIYSGVFYDWFLEENPYPGDPRIKKIMKSIKKELKRWK